jgi:hypothetical protein
MKMRFSDLYSQEQYAQAAVLDWGRSSDWLHIPGENRTGYAEACKADQRDREVLNTHKEEVFDPAMQAWLEHLRSEGRMNLMTGLKGRETILPHAWNAFVEGKADKYQLAHLLYGMQGFLTWSIITIDPDHYKRKQAPGHVRGTHVLPTEAMIEAGYQKLLDNIEAGNSDFHLRFDDIRDSKTGHRLKIELKGWHATLLKMDTASGRYDYEPAKDMVAIPLQTVEIDLPTGELLLSDWIRVPGFKEATDLGYEDGSLDISSDQGAVNTTKAHAARHNLGHVQTTNTCVIVHQDAAGRLMVSERSDRRSDDDAKAEGMKRVGDFSCDLWWVTAIDKQTLLGLMAKGGCETPQKTLDAYLASDDAYASNVVRLKVTPGRYRIHFGPDFSKRVNRKKLGIPKGPQPWLLMEPIAA